MIGSIYVESAERARFFTPLYAVVSPVVASVSRVAFDVNHLYPAVPSRVFLSESFVATLTNFRIIARLPGSCGDVLGILGVVDDGERLVAALVFRPHEGIQHTSQFTSVVRGVRTSTVVRILRVNNNGAP